MSREGAAHLRAGQAALLAAGQAFAGRYRIERLLGSGRASQVFAAVDVVDERKVAVKVFDPHVLPSATAVKRFELAMRTVRDLKGVHVATAIDAGVDGPSQIPFVVTPLLSGETLEDAVRRRGPFEVDELLECMRQLAAGLEVGHGYIDQAYPERGPTVHGNLKPGSIFLTRRLSIPWVVILDFGLAEGLEHARGSIARGRLRPPLYTAYEQLCGYTVTPRADIWALGLVAFFMLTGHHYWRASESERDEAAQRRMLFDEVLNRGIVPPSVRAAELGSDARVSAAFDAWFARCLDRDPEERFMSADVAVDELAGTLSTEHTTRRRRTPSPIHAGRWVIAVALLGAAIGGSMWARHATFRAAGGAPAPTPLASTPHDARSP